ncbi:MAG: NusG domain II-containing protein [Clostridia bacterium]|nr:NusG domain II-containing protein [Clostridia bacterium]
MGDNKKNNRNKIRNDIIFVAVLLFAAVVGILYLFVFRESGNTVKVTRGGELYGIYSLSEDITEDIHTVNGGLNRLVIKDGKAFVDSASCPDGICVAHPPVFRNGESIVCLPNKVVVTVISENDGDSPDIIA